MSPLDQVRDLSSIGPVTPPSAPAQRRNVPAPAGPAFNDVLAGAIQQQDLRLSNHARVRLEQRHIRLEGQNLASAEQAVTMAREKGSREALILLRDMALVVNVPQRLVITAVDRNQAQGQVFTNIDSVVIADQNG